jgi:hypothetical protein
MAIGSQHCVEYATVEFYTSGPNGPCSQPTCEKVIAAPRMFCNERPMSFSSLKAGTTIEIFMRIAKAASEVITRLLLPPHDGPVETFVSSGSK